MANKILIKRGLEADISSLTLLPGELGVTLDTQKLYVGDTDGNVKMVKAGAAGSVESAEKLTTARNIAISGDATGNADFDGTQNIEIALTLATSGVEAGSYNNVTVNNKGIITAATNVVYTIEDITGLKDALDAKAAKTYVDDELAKKATKDEVELKAAKTYVDEELAKKAVKETVDAELAKKATTDYVNEELAKKANASALDNYYLKTETYNQTEIDNKIAAKDSLPTQANNAGKFLTTNGTVASWADVYTEAEIDAKVQELNSAISGKASAQSVTDLTTTVSGHTTSIGELNTALGNKANSADVYTKTEMDTELGKKADKETTYTKSEVEGLLGGKADTTALDNYYKKSETYTKEEVNTALNGKVDNSTFTTELGKKADASAVSTLEQTLTGKINGKADAATTIAGYGITDAYTKAEVDGMVAGTFHFRGEAESLAQLPMDAKEGDVYQVGEKEYAWDGDSWVELGFNMDLSAYATTAAVAETYATKKSLTDGLAEKANAADVYAKADVYTKTEADAAFMTNAEVEAKGYATTSAMNTALADKADKATTLAGYGITDAYTQTKINELVGAKADKATTLAGYGITDAYTKGEIDTELNAIDTALESKLNGTSVIDGGTFGGAQA